ncbi:type II secretion system F family protein [Pseudomonadota bacterium]
MKRFKYKALNTEKKEITKGILKANNAQELETILNESGYELINVKEEKQSRSLFGFLHRITNKELMTFFIHLEQLEKASVGILDSLEELKDSSKSDKLRDVVQDLHESVKNGKLLSEALDMHKKVFSPLFISLIRSGEKTGNLEKAFHNIVEHMKWSTEIKRQTTKAIRYPLFSFTVMLISLSVMMVLVVPKVTEFILDQGIELPIYTRLLIATSNFFESYILLMIAGTILSVMFVKLLRKTDLLGTIIDEGKLKMPIFGEIIKKLEISRFVRLFGTTFNSGVPVLECIDIARSVIQNKSIKEEVLYIRNRVKNGTSLTGSFEMSGAFPSLVVRMFNVGEESGNMQEALLNVEYFYEKEVNDSIEQIIGTIQPTIIFMMGGMMAWIITAVFGPLYANFQTLTV